MNKLIAFFLVMLFGCGLLSGIIAGGGGVVVTALSENISANVTTLPVNSTTNFLDGDYVIIGGEKVCYTGTTDTSFTGCERGCDDTTANAHIEGAYVYTQTASAINYAMGFNIVAVQDELGWAAIIAIPLMFFVRTVPQIARMSTNLFVGDLAIISWIMYVLVAAFIVTLAMTLIGSRRVT